MNNDDKLLHHRRAPILGAVAATFIGAALPSAAWAADGSSARRRIGTIGSGRVGGTLGRIWLQAGHEGMFSSRNLELVVGPLAMGRYLMPGTPLAGEHTPAATLH
jgi:hypothetical protein